MKYIKSYKIFEKLGVPNIISTFISKNLKLIENSIKDGFYNFSLDEDKLKCSVNIKFLPGQNYSGNLDHKLCISSNFKKCDVKIKIPLKYNIDNIIKTLVHELTHIYELYQIKSVFDNSKVWNLNYKPFDDLYNDIDIIIYFRNLIYTSRRNEINSKISSLSVYLRMKRTNDINILKNELDNTTEWNHYKALYNFSPKKYLSDLLRRYNIDFLLTTFNYLNKIIGSKTVLSTKNDILNYFKRNKRYFRKVCKILKYRIDKILNDIKNYNFDKIMEFNEIGYSIRENNLDILLFPEYLDYIEKET